MVMTPCSSDPTLRSSLRIAQSSANDAASELQRLPDSRLRRLAASSVGLRLGFYLAGAPRLIVAVATAAALLIGAAIALRPIVPTGTPMIRLEKRPT
jgi:hypothetical protein